MKEGRPGSDLGCESWWSVGVDLTWIKEGRDKEG